MLLVEKADWDQTKVKKNLFWRKWTKDSLSGWHILCVILYAQFCVFFWLFTYKKYSVYYFLKGVIEMMTMHCKCWIPQTHNRLWGKWRVERTGNNARLVDFCTNGEVGNDNDLGETGWKWGSHCKPKLYKEKKPPMERKVARVARRDRTQRTVGWWWVEWLS